MSKPLRLIGDKFGRLTVVERVSNNSRGNSMWLCECHCGQTTVVAGSHLVNGHTNSCGCFHKDIMTRHGHSTGQISGTYKSWDHMIQRCTNRIYQQYKDYGGRGIVVCRRWLKFENFLADMGERPEGRSLDRIDNNGNYCPENCRWATRKEQQSNRRNNHVLTYGGKTQCITKWSDDIGIKVGTIQYRLAAGWSVEEALSVVPGQKRKTKQ